MTETELHERLNATVEDIDAPSDLLHRARQGGARRLRRRRFLSLTATALAVVAVGGVAVAGQDLLASNDQKVAAAPGTGDPYGFLMKGETRGDLAGDQVYLDQVLAAWKGSHSTSVNKSRGIFDDLRGEAKVAWAGNTPGGRAAIVVQQSYLHHHEDIQLDHEGAYTLAGFFGEGPDGKPALVADSYPAPRSGLATAFVAGPDKKDQALVVIDVGRQVGLSKELIYTDVGSSRRDFTALRFGDGVSIVKLPAGTNLAALRISPLPAKGHSELLIYDASANTLPAELAPDQRLWPDAKPAYVAWPMTTGAEKLRSSANETFNNTVETASDPHKDGGMLSLWTGYGVTPDGSNLLLGEFVVDAEPTRVYAVLQSKTGKTTIVPGGVPARTGVLPVSIKLPRGQGWAIAQLDGELSYRVDGGAWSAPRKNAALVPHSRNAEVKVTLKGSTKIVPLR
jgi:hypothetical protein